MAVTISITVDRAGLMDILQAIQAANLNRSDLSAIQSGIAQLQEGQKQLMADAAALQTALNNIDAATNKTATTVAAIATAVQGISDTAHTIDTEMDALIAALQSAGVSQAIIDQANALADKTGALDTSTTTVSGSLDPVVTFLQGVAAKGSTAVPPPPPPPPPTV